MGDTILLIKAILLTPKKFFNVLEFKKSLREPYLFYLKVSVPIFVLNTFVEIYLMPGGKASQLFTPERALLLVFSICGIFLLAAIINLPISLLYGRGLYEKTFYIVAYASAATSIFSIIPHIGTLISSLWFLILLIIGLNAVFGLSYRTSIIIYLVVPFILFLFRLPKLRAWQIIESSQVQTLRNKTQLDVSSLSHMLKKYKSHTGVFPTEIQGLKALKFKPQEDPVPQNWKGPYYISTLIDKWGKPYSYRIPGKNNYESFDVFSLGPDGVESEDDIGNWKN